MKRFYIPAVFVVALLVKTATACPFCSAVSQTFAQEIEALDAAVIVESVDLKKMPGPDEEGELPKSVFKVTEILKGDKWATVGKDIETHYFGERKDGIFLIFGADAPDILWTSPLRMSEKSVAYLRKVMELPESGPKRLKFFQGYLEDEDEMLSADAYDEFARASYEAVVELKPYMKRDEIIGWIKDTENVPAARRRLYLTMLGVCGEKEDARLLEEFMRSDSTEDKIGLDAMVACYLTLVGEEGMPAIKELFLSDDDAEYSHTYSAIMALRFHAAETEVLSRESVLDGLRCILDRTDLADLVIPDLARMEDWDSMPRLLELFRDAVPGQSWARVPIINFVRACPLAEADDALETLREIDPAAVKRASTFFPFTPKGAKPRGSEVADSEGSDASMNQVADGDVTKHDVSQEVQHSRTVSAEIKLPDVGDDMDFPTVDEYAENVKANPLQTETKGWLRWPVIAALGLACLIFASFVLPKRAY